MIRILIASLALCLLLLSAGKMYASVNVPVSSDAHNVMHTQACNEVMTQGCDAMGGDGGFFSHFHCHLNMTSITSSAFSMGLVELSSPNSTYQFSSKVYIQTLSTKPPQVT